VTLRDDAAIASHPVSYTISLYGQFLASDFPHHPGVIL
jgi:hypothetical protein